MNHLLKGALVLLSALTREIPTEGLSSGTSMPAASVAVTGVNLASEVNRSRVHVLDISRLKSTALATLPRCASRAWTMGKVM
ncbi:hypothetical protein D3C72_2292460 [compost metagenome]